MSRAFRLRMARQRAESVLRDRDIDTLPVDPFAIARGADIVVQAKPDTAPGVSGMLLRHGDSFGILYATHLRNEGSERFSVGHELGHFYLDGHVDHVLPVGTPSHASHAGFQSADIYEREADHFSAGLLMPTGPCRKLLAKLEPGLAAVEAMAATCRTSLTSTAIRFTELADDAVAVIMSTAGVVDYCFLSDTMTGGLPQLTPPRKGSPVPSGTATHAFANGTAPGHNLRRTEAECDVLDWLGGNRSLPATEEVLHLASYGKTLTLLTVASLLDETFQEEDEDEDADLEERWTPHFRR